MKTGFGRVIAVLVAGGMAAACTPAVGPTQVQQGQAAAACQNGVKEACYTAQALAPAAQAEANANAQNAAVGTAVAAGVVGAVAGAAIVSATTPRYYGRPYYRRW